MAAEEPRVRQQNNGRDPDRGAKPKPQSACYAIGERNVEGCEQDAQCPARGDGWSEQIEPLTPELEQPRSIREELDILEEASTLLNSPSNVIKIALVPHVEGGDAGEPSAVKQDNDGYRSGQQDVLHTCPHERDAVSSTMSSAICSLTGRTAESERR